MLFRSGQHGFGKLFRREFTTRGIMLSIDRFLAISECLVDRHPIAFNSGQREAYGKLSGMARHIFVFGLAAVSLFIGLTKVSSRWCSRFAEDLSNVTFLTFKQCRLVVLHRRIIVHFPVDDFLGDLRLTARRIDCF